MIELLIGLLLLFLVIYVVNLVVDALSLPPKIKTVIYIILGVIFLLVLLQQLGLFYYQPLRRI